MGRPFKVAEGHATECACRMHLRELMDISTSIGYSHYNKNNPADTLRNNKIIITYECRFDAIITIFFRILYLEQGDVTIHLWKWLYLVM